MTGITSESRTPPGHFGVNAIVINLNRDVVLIMMLSTLVTYSAFTVCGRIFELSLNSIFIHTM